MIRVVILGAGNIASHLCNAFMASEEVSIVQLYTRNKNSLKSLPKTINSTTNISEIKEADLYIITIPDDAIMVFSESLPFTKKLVVHTSGSVHINVLSDKNRKGVFYPLQTFSKERKLSFINIPICIEANSETDRILLKKLGKSISEKVKEIDSNERANLHLAAVFVNNFVNFLYQIGSDLLKEHKLSFDLLKPLIKETANKIEYLSPEIAQTGPAKRNDQNTIEKQLLLLKESPFRELYKELSKAILVKHKNLK